MGSEIVETMRHKISRLISHEKPKGKLWDSLIGDEKTRVLQIIEVVRDFPLNDGDLLWMTAGGSLVAKGMGNDIDLKVFTQGRGITRRFQGYLEEEFPKRKIGFVKAVSPGKSVLEGETRPVIWLPEVAIRGETKLGARPIHLILPYEGELGVIDAKQMHGLGLQSSAWVELLDRAGQNS